LSAEQTAPDPVALRSSSAFVEEVRAWVAAKLKPRGSRLTGEWEQPHTRAWSSTIRLSIGCVTRAMAWESALQDAPAAVVWGMEFPIRSWFLELLNP
jgi:hypothetical protein